MEDIIVKIIEMENEINRDIDNLVDLKREMVSVIKAVTDPEYQTILELRYLCFKSWEQIAVDMNYSIQHIHRIVYSAKLQSALFDAFYLVMSPQFGANAAECYQSRFFSYGLFGFLDEWIKRGFCETPEEITHLFLDMIKEKTDTGA